MRTFWSVYSCHENQIRQVRPTWEVVLHQLPWLSIDSSGVHRRPVFLTSPIYWPILATSRNGNGSAGELCIPVVHSTICDNLPNPHLICLPSQSLHYLSLALSLLHRFTLRLRRQFCLLWPRPFAVTFPTGIPISVLFSRTDPYRLPDLPTAPVTGLNCCSRSSRFSPSCQESCRMNYLPPTS